jgi:hypothetical protein
VVPPVAIEVALPEAFNTKVVQAIVACKRRWIVATLFTSLLRLNDVPIGNIHQHGLVLETIAAAVHVLKALEAEVVFAIGTEDLRTLHSTCGAKAATCCREGGVALARALASFVQSVETCLAEGHETLIALQC